MMVMMKNKVVLLLLSLVLLSRASAAAAAAAQVKAAYWFQDSGFPIASINTTLFTHLFCAFADLNSTTFRVTVSPSNNNSFSTFTSTLQKTNPNIKTLLSIGGGSSSPATFASMASSPTSRKAFINSSITLARSYSFHGLDLDYEYPSSQSDMTNFGTLLSEWRAAINAESNTTKKTPLLLTAAVFYRSDYYTLPYPAATIASTLDWLNLMAYDFWGPLWSNVTRPASALYDPATGVSGSVGITSWIGSGVPATKLVLGVPFYGYGYVLAKASNNGYLAATTGPALSADGSATYKQVKAFVSANNAVTVYNATTVESYSYAGTTWITYDDVDAISTKMAFVKQKGLLGYFAWHVGADDNFKLARTAANSF